MIFCTLKAKELDLKERGKNVDVEKRLDVNFQLKNWHLRLFRGRTLTLQEGNLALKSLNLNPSSGKRERYFLLMLRYFPCFPYFIHECSWALNEIGIIYFQSYVSPDRKDDKYWEKRGKNNVAARRSREARRLKENQISLRTAFLEQQNASLKAALNSVKEKNDKLSLERKALLDKLKKYESVSPFLDDQTHQWNVTILEPTECL